jgi:class III poly(R)-hydroxyalkanoic acid synthase PhaE subunit
MDKTNPNRGGFDWQEAQRRYLDAISAFGKAAGVGDPFNPWAGALDYWWKSVAPAVADSEKAIFGNLVNQSKTFFGLADQFGKMMAAAASAQDKGADWKSVFDRHLESLKEGMGHLGGAGAAAGQAQPLASFWQLPLDTWERTMSSLSAMPGDMFKGLKGEAPLPAPERFPSIPGIGYTKEFQDQLQLGARLWAEYQKCFNEYQALLSAAGARAVDILRERIVKLDAEGGKIRSLREIYDLWVDCNEEAYSELVYSKEYSQKYGRMVNSLMAFKRHAQLLVDEGLAALNMPTQRAMDTMQKRQVEIRRDLHTAQERQRTDAEAIEKLRRELEALKREIRSAGKGRPEPAAGAAKPPRAGRKAPRGGSAESPVEAPE